MSQAKNNGSQPLQQESSSRPQLANNKPASTNNKPASTNNKPASTNNKPVSTNNKPASANNKIASINGGGEQDDLSEDNFKPSRYDLFHYAIVPTRQRECPFPLSLENKTKAIAVGERTPICHYLGLCVSVSYQMMEAGLRGCRGVSAIVCVCEVVELVSLVYTTVT